MKKVLLLALLLVVAASAAITFPNGAPSKVGEAVEVVIPSGTFLLYIDDGGGNKTWVWPTTSPTSSIEVTHPGTGFKLVAVGPTTEESELFDVVIGDPAKWQSIALGEIRVPGDATNPAGKSGSGSVTAGDTNTYDVNLCDKWYNTIEDAPTGYTITTDDEFDYVSDNDVELRIARSKTTVTISGGSYTDDESDVAVNFGSASQLLMICDGDTIVPGDNSVSGSPGKKGNPAIASVLADYGITIWAVDKCWNPVTNYTGTEDVVVSTTSGSITTETKSISGGRADVVVQFPDINSNGEWISANAGALQTGYDTRVVVQAGVTSVNASLSKTMVPPDVTSDLRAAPTIVNDPVTAGYACYIDLLEDLTTGDPTTFNSDAVMYTIQDGTAESLVWATAEGEYHVEVTCGAAKDTVVLTVKELTSLLIAPNPYKNSLHGNIPINFNYKVEQKGAGGDAIEVVLLIADIYGNVVYKATYDSGSEVEAGQQTIAWNKTNNNDKPVVSGMYQAVLKITLGDGSTPAPLKKNFMVIW